MSTGPSLHYEGYGSYDFPKTILSIKPLNGKGNTTVVGWKLGASFEIFLNRKTKFLWNVTKGCFCTYLTRKVSQVSLGDFNDSLICCRASKNKKHVIFFIGGKTDLGGEIDPLSYGFKGMFSWFFIEQVDIF